jgi:phosphate transport system substrate-binding protein
MGAAGHVATRAKHGFNTQETGAKFLSDSVKGVTNTPIRCLRLRLPASAGQVVLPLVAVLLSACGGGSNASTETKTGAAPSVIQIDGSSTVFPITEAVAEDFQKGNQGIRVTVGISGTGGGFQKFCRGETDISDASRPISATEIEACKKAGIEYIELPIAYDGLAVVVNPKNSWASSITGCRVEEDVGALRRRARSPSGIRCVPPGPIARFICSARGVDSGTFDYFTEATVGRPRRAAATSPPAKTTTSWSRVSAETRFALGFLPLAYVEQNKNALKLLPVDDGKKENGDGPITPTAETVRNGTYQPLVAPALHLRGTESR